MSQKKVVQLTSAHNLDDARIFQRQAKSLANAGYDVTVLGIGNEFKDERTSSGVRIKSLKGKRSIKARLTVTAFKLILEAFREKADIYQFHDPELIVWALPLRLTGRKVIMDLHEDFPATVQNRKSIPRWLRLPLQLIIGTLIWFSCKLYSGVITADKAMEERYSKWVRHRSIKAIRNYPFFQFKEEDVNLSLERYEKGIIIFLGGINENRVAREFFDAIQLIRRRNLEIFVGGMVNDAQLLSQLQKHPSWNLIKFVGPLSAESMQELSLRASLSINLFSDSPNHHSIRSNRMFEAMSAGLPIIVSDFDATRTFVEEYKCGVAAAPHDPVSISQQINYILENPAEAAALAVSARAAATKDFNWHVEEKNLLELYSAILL